MNKRLIVYFSQTGNSKLVAEALAPLAGADIDPIKPLRPYRGIMPINGIWHVLRKKKPDIETERLDCRAYDCVVLITPIWAGTIPPHVRTYFSRNRSKVKVFELISLSGSSGDEGVREALKDGFGMEARNALLMHNKDIKDGSFKAKIEAFAAKLGE